MSIPLNRVVAFAGPYISIAAGAVVAWLLTKINLAGIPGLDHDTLATQLAAALSFSLTAALTWAGQSKWLKGHHIMLHAASEQGLGELVGVKPSKDGES